MAKHINASKITIWQIDVIFYILFVSEIFSNVL